MGSAPGPRIRLDFREPHDPRPANVIFVLREGYGEIGFEHDPEFSTTTLRSLLLGLNNKDYEAGLVVATAEGRFIPVGSTLGKQGVMPGARLRLASPDELDLCAQS